MKLDTFINRPVLSTVISIFIVILGVVGMLWLPITQYPDIAPPTIQVSTTYTGADAKTVLNSVIAPIEEQINGAEGMTYIQSTATNTGSATITVYFEQGFDPDMAAVDVQNRVSKAQSMLPAEVTRVGVITQKRQTSMLLVFSLLSPDGKFEQEFIENYMKINVIPQIQRVNGVGDAMVMGADYSMRIWLKPDAMAQHNLMPSDVSAALADQNIEAAPGQFGENGGTAFQYVMRYRGRLITPEEFDKIIIRADKDGNVLYLKDVATMELGRVSYGFKGKTNGHPAASAIIFQTAGSNATQVIKDVEAKINRGVYPRVPCGLRVPSGLAFNHYSGNRHSGGVDWYVLRTLFDWLLNQLVDTLGIGARHCDCGRRCDCGGRGGPCQTRRGLHLGTCCGNRRNAGDWRRYCLNHPCHDACVYSSVVYVRNVGRVLSPVWFDNGNRHRTVGIERIDPVAGFVCGVP